MSNARILNDLRKAKEEEYFRKKEQELIQKMRQRAIKDQERQELAEFFFIEDAEMLNDLQELGYSRDTIFLLFLVPVIHVAWIDGSVTEQEREAILEIATERGMEKDSPAEFMLRNWLNKRPPDEFFEKTLRLIRNILKTRPKAVRLVREQTLAHYCNVVANASGGFLGYGKVSAAQQELIRKITSDSQRNHPAATAMVLKEVGAILDKSDT
jgi:hypothetical protein